MAAFKTKCYNANQFQSIWNNQSYFKHLIFEDLIHWSDSSVKTSNNKFKQFSRNPKKYNHFFFWKFKLFKGKKKLVIISATLNV